MSEPSPSDADLPLVRLRSYARLVEAREAALALAAREWAFKIEREGKGWALLTEEPQVAEALAELESVEEEQRSALPPVPQSFGVYRPWSLVLAGLVLVAVFVAQARAPVDLLKAGDADAAAVIRQGQWWRCLTALTLHADLGHIVANLAVGGLFAGFLIPQLGTGATWLLVLLSGTLGNLLNSWGYRGEWHHSIGASTAVFGALGLLVAAEGCYRWRAQERSRWRLLGPIGGGLALLAFLGVGDPHESIDFMAHWWGFVAGLALGWPAAVYRLRERLGGFAQFMAGALSVGLLALAWGLALRAPLLDCDARFTLATRLPVLAYYLHDLSPFIVRFPNGMGLHWYGLAYVVAFLGGYWLYRWLSEHRYNVIPPAEVADFITWAAVFGVMLGGRLGHVIFYAWEETKADPLSALRVWQGGMASHGGILGLVLFTLYYSIRHKRSWTSIGDSLVTVAPIGLFLVRCANFINGELWGKPSTVPWAMQFPDELSGPERPPLRLIQHDESVRQHLREILTPRHPSQLYEALLEGLLLFFLLWTLRTRFRLPRGVLTGCFFIFYAVLRIIGEIFREPDPHWAVGHLSAGQFLSLFLPLIGVGFLVWAYRTRQYEAAFTEPQR